MAAKKKITMQPVTPESNEPLKVGDIVTLKPVVGVVYEVGYNSEHVRIQSATGEKYRGILSQTVVPANATLKKQFLTEAPDELKPEAIIAREKAEHSGGGEEDNLNNPDSDSE